MAGNGRAEKRTGIEAIRARELTTILRHRYGTTLPDDDAGRDDLRLMLAHVAHLPHGTERMEHFIDLWTPWLGAERCLFLEDAARAPPPRFTADQLAELLGLTLAERDALGITTIGAIDCLRAERLQRRKRMKAEAERERRRRKREADAAATQRVGELSECAMALRCALLDGEWHGVNDLAATVAEWDLFKPRARQAQKPGTLLRKIRRALDELIGHGLVKERRVRTRNGLEMRVVRLAEEPAEPLSTPICPPGHADKALRAG